MAITTSTRLGLPGPDGDDPVDQGDDRIRGLRDAIDLVMAWDGQGTLAARPAATVRGKYYFATDNGELYRSDGTNWHPVRLARPVVTALPTAVFDGQEVAFLADAANGVIWHLKYVAGDPSAFHWLFMGGASLVKESTTTETIGNGAATAVAPHLVFPLAGQYEVLIGHRTWHSSPGRAQSTLALRAPGGVAAGTTSLLTKQLDSDLDADVTRLVSGPSGLTVAASDDYSLTFTHTDPSAQGRSANRFIIARPVRVG